MASRGELVQIAQELDIEYDDLSIEELDEKIRPAIDKKFNRKFLVGINDISDTLLHFMLYEYDYKLFNQEGDEVTL